MLRIRHVRGSTRNANKRQHTQKEAQISKASAQSIFMKLFGILI